MAGICTCISSSRNKFPYLLLKIVLCTAFNFCPSSLRIVKLFSKTLTLDFFFRPPLSLILSGPILSSIAYAQTYSSTERSKCKIFQRQENKYNAKRKTCLVWVCDDVFQFSKIILISLFFFFWSAWVQEFIVICMKSYKNMGMYVWNAYFLFLFIE